MSVSPSEFAGYMSHIFGATPVPDRIAVAVSGGGDSVALLRLMQQWAATHAPRIQIHVLTVDHGLRSESKAEAKQVVAWVKQLSLKHKILTWVGEKPKTKIAETARAKRYELMADYCARHNISHLFLAHHADDQAETVLMRLAAGSGVDGLAGMEIVTQYKNNSSIKLCRPLLSATHRQLLDTLREAGQDWIEDPSNKNPKSARVRVRTARDVLAAEGLTADRMGKLAIRVARARDVLNAVADRAWSDEVQVMRTSPQSAVTVTILRDDFEAWFMDTQIRVMMRAIETVSGRTARLEQVEDVVEAFTDTAKIAGEPKTIRRTLAGCIITSGAKWVKITPET